MEFNMITDSHNCDDGYISLVNIDLGTLPGTIDVDEYTLSKKGEFHISLVCLKQLDKILIPEISKEQKSTIQKTFLEFHKSQSLTDFHLTGEYRLARRGDKVTVVAMVSVKGLKELFEKLRTSTGIDLPTQPTHITLYTLQPEVGIGLTSQEQVENESKTVDLPVLSSMRAR